MASVEAERPLVLLRHSLLDGAPGLGASEAPIRWLAATLCIPCLRSVSMPCDQLWPVCYGIASHACAYYYVAPAVCSYSTGDCSSVVPTLSWEVMAGG